MVHVDKEAVLTNSFRNPGSLHFFALSLFTIFSLVKWFKLGCKDVQDPAHGIGRNNIDKYIFRLFHPI